MTTAAFKATLAGGSKIAHHDDKDKSKRVFPHVATIVPAVRVKEEEVCPRCAMEVNQGSELPLKEWVAVVEAALQVQQVGQIGESQ